MPRSRHSAFTARSDVFRIDRAGRVVRRHGDDGARARRDRARDRIEVELIVGASSAPAPAGAPAIIDRHLVIEVVRHREDHLVAGIGDREHRVHEREVAAGGDDHAAAGPDADAVLARELVFERVDERRQAFDRTVAVIVERRRRIGAPPRCASGGGPYDTMPCPSEIVPGVSAVQRPMIGMTGVWTAARRLDCSDGSGTRRVPVYTRVTWRRLRCASSTNGPERLLR